MIYKSAPISTSGAGAQTLITGVSNMIIQVYKLWLVVGAATDLQFKSNTSNLSGVASMIANGALVLDDVGPAPWFVTAVGEAFVMNSSAAVNIGGQVWYTQAEP
jgi:uncharacterized membrane protein